MDIPQPLKESFDKLQNESKERKDREHSWQLCHEAFQNQRGKPLDEGTQQLLALHLSGFLASWGMYRGSSALLTDYSYLVHEGLIPILMKTDYDCLFDIDPRNYEQGFKAAFDEAYMEIRGYYQKLPRFKNGYEGEGFKPSPLLVTKIMLGVYGCTPAYDINVTASLKKLGAKRCSLEGLLALPSCEEILYLGEALRESYPSITLMRAVDMLLSRYGYEDRKAKK